MVVKLATVLADTFNLIRLIPEKTQGTYKVEVYDADSKFDTQDTEMKVTWLAATPMIALLERSRGMKLTIFNGVTKSVLYMDKLVEKFEIFTIDGSVYLVTSTLRDDEVSIV